MWTLELETDLTREALLEALAAWQPWGHRIEFSNGVSTAECVRRVPFSDEPLGKLRLAAKHLPLRRLRGGRVLDVGFNAGYNAIYCAQKLGLRATGIDISPRHLEVARFLSSLAGVSPEFLLEDAEDFSRPESFDLVLHFGTLYHLRNPVRSLERSFENLEPGGYLALETQVYDDLADPNLCYFMRGQNDDPTNFWALSTKVLHELLDLVGFRRAVNVHRATPAILEDRMSRLVVVARKPRR